MSGKLSTFTKKRIFADVRELQQDASTQYSAEPLEDNLFEWHFTLRGPTGTDFEGGERAVPAINLKRERGLRSYSLMLMPSCLPAHQRRGMHVLADASGTIR
jgi:ubiquitin-conjugating enzyme E2 J1